MIADARRPFPTGARRVTTTMRLLYFGGGRLGLRRLLGGDELLFLAARGVGLGLFLRGFFLRGFR